MKSIMVQFCPCGHSYESDDPEHIEKDKIRFAKGYIDALILSSDECEECKSLNENRYIDSLYLDYWDTEEINKE